jgi:pimeloyl-ACP methyl ester carboxylesterase
MDMESVTSRDGTTIAFDRMGEGPPVVLVTGGSVDRMSNAPLGQELASKFTVLTFDRRGRGRSGATRPYAIEREIGLASEAANRRRWGCRPST